MRTRFPQQQRFWFIDPASGNDEATGEDSGHPIKTDRERNFRLGPNPTLASGDYHIYFLGDSTEGLAIRGTFLNSNVYVHGSTTNGQGASSLYASTIDSGTVAQDRPNNIPWQIKSNAIPTSWTASGLVASRIRMTSGAASGATAWAMLDLGTKTARVCEFVAGPAAYAYPYTNPSTMMTPVVGDSFVVETLRSLSGQFLFNTQGSFANVIFDSINFPALTSSFSAAGTRISFYGCNEPAAPTNPPGHVDLIGGQMPAGIRCISGACRTFMRGGFGTLSSIQCGTDSAVIHDFIQQGGRLELIGGGYGNDNGGFLIGSIGGFACNALVEVKTSAITFADGFLVWGSGNDLAFRVRAGGQVISHQSPIVRATHMPITSTTDLNIGGKTSLQAYDPSLGIYTPARLMSWTNVLALVSAGGFCATTGIPQITDPNTGATFSVHVP